MFDIILLILSLFSFVEIICIEYGFGIAILSIPMANIILALSYSILGSSLFYLINMYIPQNIKKKKIYIVINRKLDDLTNVRLKQFHDELTDGRIFTKESLYLILSKGNIEIHLKHLEYLIKRIELLCDELFYQSQYLDPELFIKIDEIRYECQSINLKNYLDIEDNEIERFVDIFFPAFKIILEQYSKIKHQYLEKKLLC